MNSLIILNLITGVCLAAIVAFVAYRFQSLSRGGAIAAVIVGAVVFGFGGWNHAVPMVVFFATSSGLSRWRKVRKNRLGFEKSGRRDAAQVFANGGVAAVCALLPMFGINPARVYMAYLAALAAANADTWATEIGSAAGGKPFLITTFERVDPGASGAISPLGIVAALSGSTLLSFWAPNLVSGIIVCFSGFSGSLLDSFAGATLQAQWIEQKTDSSGSQWMEFSSAATKPDRGYRFFSNDVVNVICALSAAIIAAIV
jgi:uncharacterized protein (TIGR00297 family)